MHRASYDGTDEAQRWDFSHSLPTGIASIDLSQGEPSTQFLYTMTPEKGFLVTLSICPAQGLTLEPNIVYTAK
jgi:hypothetical protein